jgi:hypothetical protein
MRFILRVFILSGLLGAVAFGQSAAINGQISGTVTDPSGSPVAGARVEAVNAGTGYQQATTTGESGQYQIPLLPIGEYSVKVDAQGFTPYRRTGVGLSAGAVATIDVGLQLQGVATEVVVEGGAPVVDIGRTDVGSTLSSNAIANLPLVSRNPYNFILQQPGVSGRSNTEFGVPRSITSLTAATTFRAIVRGFACCRSPRRGFRKCRRSATASRLSSAILWAPFSIQSRSQGRMRITGRAHTCSAERP